jgi:hypothetical protein
MYGGSKTTWYKGSEGKEIEIVHMLYHAAMVKIRGHERHEKKK